MTSRQHQNWIDHGRPDSGLARPLAQLRDVLRVAGYTVYDFPNDAHLDAQPPEDHTYYSETGWPGASPKWWRHAIDIMPPTRPGLPSLQDLGQRIFMARQAGRITWLKYMNWPSTGNLDHAVQDRWEPSHERSTSRDSGHIHLSSITGCETLSDPYNPFAGPLEDDMPLSQDDIINVASAVVQWATEGGALPGQFRGAHTNLLSLETQINGVKEDLSAVKSAVSTLAVPAPAVVDVNALGNALATNSAFLDALVTRLAPALAGEIGKRLES